MWVISKAPLRSFWERYPDAKGPLTAWWKVASKASWDALTDVRRSYPHADALTLDDKQTVTIFNVGGNKFRLITRIVYSAHVIYVKRVLTHAEYDRGSWKAQLCRH